MFLIVVMLGGCSDGGQPKAGARQSAEPATNIILLIGDGMGPEVIGLAKDYAQALEKRELWMEKVLSDGHLALVRSTATGKLAADSAAAATALATGVQVDNMSVSVTPEGKPLTTILEMARVQSKSTGLVTTTRLTHATPACFAAHTADRDSEAEIAKQLASSDIDVMMGGGLTWWIPAGKPVAEYARFGNEAGVDYKSSRTDELNLLTKAISAGYRLATNRDELLAANRTGKLLGLFASSHLPYALDRQPNDAANVPSLAEMTEVALSILSKNQKGFFLMVEGGRIDHAAHNNDVASLIADMLDFDEAVGVAYTFAEKHPNTALFITADHATGAPSLSARYDEKAGDTVYPDDSAMRKISRQDASFERIMTTLAVRPSAAALRELVAKHTGIKLSDEDAAFIMKAEPVSPFHVIRPKYRQFGYPTLALGRVLGVEYGTAWATAEHYATPVLLIGYGPRSNLAHGYLENTDVFKIMKTAGAL